MSVFFTYFEREEGTSMLRSGMPQCLLGLKHCIIQINQQPGLFINEENSIGHMRCFNNFSHRLKRGITVLE